MMSRIKFDGAGDGEASTAFSPASVGGCDEFIILDLIAGDGSRAQTPAGSIFSTACSIRANVVSRPTTCSVSNSGGAFFRPQTATRIGWNICPAFNPNSLPE